ncbi:sugar ABC transporter permease [Clostridium sp.]|uniref:sugar ABC transporter permease n=1 Tax=Clostridium sp. TaxID=1506 RepID=UPI002FCBBADF
MRNKEKFKYKKKLTKGEKRTLLLSRIFIWVIIVITLIPIVAVISSSMAPGESFVQSTFFPEKFTLENYKEVLVETEFLLWMKNSLKICVSVALLQLCMSIPAAFAFSKLKFRGRKKGLMGLLILQMFPSIMALPAILGVVYTLGLMDKSWVLILIIGGGSAYNIWLLKGFIDGIPNDLVEAAYVDGASTFQVFIKIILPLTRNMLIVIFLFAFIAAYSEFIFTSSLLKDASNQTIATGLKQFITNNFSANWSQYSAAAIMASTPIVILFMASQKFIASGLTAGSVKE